MLDRFLTTVAFFLKSFRIAFQMHYILLNMNKSSFVDESFRKSVVKKKRSIPVRVKILDRRPFSKKNV